MESGSGPPATPRTIIQPPRITGEERYRCIVHVPPGAAVGGWKSILDGGYSGPSSHIFLDMNLCLRSTCLRLSLLRFSSFLVSFVLLPATTISRVPAIHHTRAHNTIFLSSRPPSPCLRSLLRVFAPSRLHLHSPPPVPLQQPPTFLLLRYSHPLLPRREDDRQWREFTPIRDSNAGGADLPFPFVSPLTKGESMTRPCLIYLHENKMIKLRRVVCDREWRRGEEQAFLESNDVTIVGSLLHEKEIKGATYIGVERST